MQTNNEMTCKEITSIDSELTLVEVAVGGLTLHLAPDDVEINIPEMNKELLIATACATLSFFAPVSAQLSVPIPGTVISFDKSQESIVPQQPCAELICSGDTVFVNILQPGKTIIVTSICDMPPTQSDAGDDQVGEETCGLSSVQLLANTPSSGVGSWSVISGTGGSFSNALSASAIFSGTPGVEYVLRWTVSNYPYNDTFDEVTVKLNQEPTTASAGIDQTITAAGTAQLAANTPTVGVGVWSVSGPSTNLAQFSDINSPTAVFDPEVIGDYVLTWTITNDPCGQSSDSLNLTVQVSSFVISGKIIWEHNRLGAQTGVAGVVVTLSGTESQTMTTGVDGLYSFTVAGTGSYNVSCAKNSVANALNGVAVSDATRVNQHVLGILPLTDPYKLIAADVNGSNSVSSADASQIQQAALGNPISKAAFALKTWIMVPQAYSFPNSLAPWGYSTVIALNDVSTAQTNKNFIGIKLGDVNGTADPSI